MTAATAADIAGLTVAQGGTGAVTFSNGGLLVGSGTGAIGVLANSTYTLTGTLGGSKTITSLTVAFNEAPTLHLFIGALL